jgi:hypothetical protein
MKGVRLHRFLAAAAVLAAASPAAAQPAPDAGEHPAASLDEILARAVDEAMRARWRALAQSGQLPPLRTLTLRAEPRTRRVRVLAQARAPQPGVAPVQQPGQLDLVLGQGLDRYTGEMSVNSVKDGRVSGRLEESSASVDIRFDLPGPQQQLDLDARETVASTLRNEVVGVSHREEVALADEDGTLLLYVSEGSPTPYRREFKDLPLTVQQLPPGPGGESSLHVRFGSRQFVLAPGERRGVEHEGEAYQVYVGATSYTPPEQRLLVEAEPFYVRLMVFRKDGPAR